MHVQLWCHMLVYLLVLRIDGKSFVPVVTVVLLGSNVQYEQNVQAVSSLSFQPDQGIIPGRCH